MKMTCLVLIFLLTASPAFATETVDGKEGDLPVAAEPVVLKAHDLRKKFTAKPAGTIHLVGADIDPVSNSVFQVKSPTGGTILGSAQNQFIGPGFAIFRIGHKQTVDPGDQNAIIFRPNLELKIFLIY